MGKALKEKIEALYEATKDLQSRSEIEPHCQEFNEWIKSQDYNEASLGTLFSRYGLYSKFKRIKLEKGKNAEQVEKRDANSNLKGYELKHYVPLLCGLNQNQWDKRNESSKVTERNLNPTELNPDDYLNITGVLLASDDPHELAVGLIAATGRRPHEIVARAKFTPVVDKPYHVSFEGQGKKRGEKPIIEIPTLYPAEYVIKALARYRKISNTKSLLKEVETQFPNDLPEQNRAIDSRRNSSLNRIVKAFFGSQNANDAILKFRHGEEHYSNRGLRAAYTAIAVKRDCKGGIGESNIYASKILGHTTDENKMATTATIAYTDYLITKPVAFPETPKREHINQIRLIQSDMEVIKELQALWDLPNQPSVISRLIERHQKNVELGKQLQNFEAEVKALKRENQELKIQLSNVSKVEVKTKSEGSDKVDETLESKIERIVEEKLTAVLDKLSIQSATNPTFQTTQKIPETPNHDDLSNIQLWDTKVKGSSEEKIKRCFNAIRLYNDTIATGDNDRLAITSQALRELSGVNGLIVGDWVKSHGDEIISHNAKYEMQNPKDPSNPTTYYNKRHGSEKITEILKEINAKLLDKASPVG